MKTTTDSRIIRAFRLTNEPGGLGLSCTPAGISLAGVPLLRSTAAGLVPRPPAEIRLLLKVAFGDDRTELQSRLGAIAQALNRGDFAAAIIAAVHTRTPELSVGAARQLTNAEQELNKYNYNPDEPRDWHGRWTRDETASLADFTPQSVGDAFEGSALLTQPFAEDPDNLAAVDVAANDNIMRSIVKNACIAECSESSLPTYDYGWKFFNCINDCMRRHGYDPFSVRP